MNELLRRFRPDAVAVEELFWNTNQTTGIRVAEARGVLLLAARQNLVSIYEYTPLQVKQAVVGYGRAEKKACHQHGDYDSGAEGSPKARRYRRCPCSCNLPRELRFIGAFRFQQIERTN